jgi:hypothetical protein
MASLYKLADLDAARRVVLFAGILLISTAFWFPRESVLHGFGAGAIGLMFLWFLRNSNCGSIIALVSATSALLCVVGGFSYTYDGKLSFALSIGGLGLAALALGVYVVRTFGSRRTP